MIFEETGKYYRVCDICGEKKEIQRQSFVKNSQKTQHFCLSCVQKGSRNHRYGLVPWNKGLYKAIDDRVKCGADKISATKQGANVWNSGRSYEELKGKQWSDNFKSKISSAKTGVPNYKKRKIIDRSKTASYFRHRCRALLYAEWTSKVLQRDNYTCQLCGYKRELEVHHIRKFSKILMIVADRLGLCLDDYKAFTDSEYELFRDEVIKEHKLEDGITLCKECHKGIDKDRRRFNVCNKSAIIRND